MKEPKVITVPNLKLNEVTEKVTSFEFHSNTLKTQIAEMVKVLRQEGGIGLAANQLGFKNRLITIEFENVEKKNAKDRIPLTIFINPEIIKYSPELECFEEGCLSVPKIELEVERPLKLKLKYQNVNGRRLKIAPKGLLARIIQHEIDHLNGILFTERAKEQFFSKYPEFKNLKIAFLGSGEFGAVILEGLILLGLNLEIYTEKSKPAGRNQETKLTAVAEVATKFGKKYIEIDDISHLSPITYNLLLCCDFGQKIPNSILQKAKIAAINIHPSLLPKYIGPTPIQTAILNGDKTTGVSIIKMTDKIDEGPIYSQIETDILENDTTFLLRDRLATLALKLLIKTLPKIARDELELIKQDLSKAIRTRKFTKTDGEIDWKKSSEKIEAQIRAFYPWPGSYTRLPAPEAAGNGGQAYINGKRLIIHKAHLKNNKLVLEFVQPEGKKPMKFSEFVHGLHGQKPKWFEKIKF